MFSLRKTKFALSSSEGKFWWQEFRDNFLSQPLVSSLYTLLTSISYHGWTRFVSRVQVGEEARDRGAPGLNPDEGSEVSEDRGALRFASLVA